MRPPVVFFEDRFVDLDDARVRVDDRGLLLGEGVFVTMRARRARCFRKDEHLDRLRRGAELFRLVLPLSSERLAAIADEAADRTGERDAYVRITATRRGDGGTTLFVLARALAVPAEADRDAGVRVGIVGLRKPPPACADPYVKTTSYAGPVLARREAEQRGLAEGLQLALDDSVASGAMSNLFVVHGSRVTTPPLATGARAGVTREVVIELARAAGHRVEEAAVSTADLASADEIFLTSTRIGCLPVAEVEGIVRRGGPFPVTRALHAALEQRIDEA